MHQLVVSIENLKQIKHSDVAKEGSGLAIVVVSSIQLGLEVNGVRTRKVCKER